MQRATTSSDAARRSVDVETDLSLRAIRRSDTGALRAAFEILSERSRYARFRGLPQMGDAQWEQFCDVDGIDHVALVVVTARGAIVGVGRFIRLTRHEHAEVALTVADAYQRRGLGRSLVRALLPLARARSIATLVAYAASDNLGIVRLLVGEGGAVRHHALGEVTIALPTGLRAGRPSAPAVDTSGCRTVSQ